MRGLYRHLTYSVLLRPSPLFAEGIWNREFSLWKRIKWFRSTLRYGNLKTIVTGHFGFGLKNALEGSSHDFREVILFKMLSVHTETKSRRFQTWFLQFEERFRKASFWWRIGEDGSPNRRNKASLSNFSEKCWRGLNFNRLTNAQMIALHHEHFTVECLHVSSSYFQFSRVGYRLDSRNWIEKTSLESSSVTAELQTIYLSCFVWWVRERFLFTIKRETASNFWSTLKAKRVNLK